VVQQDGPIYLLNNLWDQVDATGWQSITATGPTSWSTRFQWTRPDDWRVTSYVAAILGWHWGWLESSTGLPIPVVGTQSVPSESSFVVINYGGNIPVRYAVIYDLWFHATPTPTTSDPRREMTIWLSYSQDYLGVGLSYPAYPTIGGQNWKLYVSARGSTLDTASFLLVGSNLSGASLDIKDFVDWMVTNRPDILPPTYWLTGVEFGIEVYKGDGALDVTRYTVAVQ
jgi:hypothetical protein